VSSPQHAARIDVEKPDIWPLPSANFYGYAEKEIRLRRFTFGWTQRDGFMVQQETAVRTKTLHKFPLTEEGWDETWQLMATQYPDLAQAVATKALANQDSHRAAKANQEAKDELDSLHPFATVTDCTLLGGHGYDPTLQPGLPCVLHFTDEGLWVRATTSWIPLMRVPYTDAKALEFSGPGEVKKGGKFFGGGFGVVGAVEGMIAASVLNALTSQSSIQTIIRFEATEFEAFFFHSQTTPDKLRISLSQAVSRTARTVAASATVASDPIADLERLARLHDQGALSDEEFAALKAKLIAKISGE
jgi:hypothetical protein